MPHTIAANVTATLSVEEIDALRNLADTIRLRSTIPGEEHADLRSSLFANALNGADYLVRHRPQLLQFATRMMQHDIADFTNHLLTKKAQILAAATPLDAQDGEDDGEALQVADPHDGWADFVARIDRAALRRARANWRRRFRRRLNALPTRRLHFLLLLAGTSSRAELMSATGLSRKSCYLHHQWLKENFADLLAQHRNLVG